MNAGEAFLIFWAITAVAIGGMFGLAGYLGFRAGYAKARRTQISVIFDILRAVDWWKSAQEQGGTNAVSERSKGSSQAESVEGTSRRDG